MTAETPDLARCVADYATRLHAAAGQRHHVASALGAWLLLALAAPASSGADRERLTGVLGCDADTAARYAAELLDHPHPVVASAAAVWTRAGRQADRAIPAVAGCAAGRRRPAATCLARRRWTPGLGSTRSGLIDRFPLDTSDA